MPAQTSTDIIKAMQKEQEEKKAKKLKDELDVINKRLMDRADGIALGRKIKLPAFTSSVYTSGK